MTTTEQRLADALRALYTLVPFDGNHADEMAKGKQLKEAREALAAYDAQASRLPTEYRVTTEWDSFEALTPRGAASEVWEKIKRSEGPIFTVYGRDGSVTDVDLSEDDYNA